MIIKLRIGHIRITFTIARIIDVLGVNSKLPDGNHILMWDFDNTPLGMIKMCLNVVQQRFKLPNIYILRSSEPDNYIAYCFYSTEFWDAVTIISSTGCVDWNFFKWGVFRHRFTLRVGAKAGVTPKCAAILYSKVTETANIEELRSWVTYETLDMHHSQRILIVEKGYHATH